MEDGDALVLDTFTNKMMPDVDMFDARVVLGILG